MTHELVRLRVAMLGVMGLVAALPGCATQATIVDDVDTDADTDADTDTDVARTCDEAEEATHDNKDAIGWEMDTPWMVCGPMEPDGCAPVDDLQFYSWLYEQLGDPPEPEFCGWWYQDVCGPEAAEADRCCYVMDLAVMCEGRPLSVGDTAHTAPSVRRADWAQEAAFVGANLGDDARAVVAERWRVAASFEHASVASFARFSLELMALGAPPELLASAAAAMADEVRHATASYGVASALLGRPIGPGVLAPDLGPVRDAAEVLRATILEGCLAETVASARATEAARLAVPALRPLLQGIAADETRHAALAWRTVRWLLSARPDLAAVAQGAFDEAMQPPGPAAASAHSDALLAMGCLPNEVRVDVLRRVQREVIGPCARALMDSVG